MTLGTVTTLTQFDWKRLRRSSTFWWLTILLITIGVYAAFYGRSEVKEQQQKIGVLKKDIDSSMQLVQTRLQKQGTIASWQWDDFLYALHSNQPDGMAALAFGQRDLHKFAVSITIGTYFYNKYAGGYENKTLSGEIANPQQQAAGHLDVSFVLVFLLPIYFILISYNLLSHEREGGTLVLLAVQQTSIRHFIFIKLALRVLIAIVAGGLIIVGGAIINKAITDHRLPYFLLATVLYVLAWAGVIALIISLKKSSDFNALLLIGIWLLFSIAMPAAFTAALNVTHPTGTQSDLAETVQKANARVFGTPRKELAKRFYVKYPQYNNLPGDSFPGSWYNPRWVRAAHLLLDEEVKPYEDLHTSKTQQRIAAADRLDYYSPALLAQSIFNRTAASDAGQTFAFDTSIYHHFALWRDYIDYRTYLRGDYLTRKEFEELPRGNFSPLINYAEINKRLLALFAISIFLLLMSYYRMKKSPLNKSLVKTIKQAKMRKIFTTSVLVLAISIVSAQSGAVIGTIIDENNKPINGASVSVLNLKQGTVTDIDGFFMIKNIVSGIYTIEVSGTGFVAQKQNVSVGKYKITELFLQLFAKTNTLKDVIITAKTGYLKSGSSLGTRTDLPIREIPQAIQITTSALIKAQGATSYKQIVKNFSGAIQNTPYQRFTHRGFVSYNNFLVNGVKTATYISFNQQPALFNVESVENLKGPSSALFGENEPGGIINFNLKKPMFTNRIEADVFGGRWDTYGGMIDITQPLSSKTAYRFVAGYERTNSFRRPQKGNNFLLNPSLLVRFSEKSNLNLDFTYQQQKTGYSYDRGIIGYKNTDGSFDTNRLPLSWTATSKNDHTDNNGYSAGAEFKNVFSDKLDFTSLLRYSYVKTDSRGHEQYYGYPVFGTPDSVKRYYNIYDLEEDDLNWTNFLNYKFTTRRVLHTLTTGIEVRTYHSKNIYLEHDVVPSIRLNNPDYGLDNSRSYTDSSYYENSKYNSLSYAFYIQDQVSFGEKWLLSASLRYQHYRYIAKAGIASPNNYVQNPDSSLADTWLPRFGIVYLANNYVALYANYATSFVPQYSNYRSYGGPFKPEVGKQTEIGAKFNLRQNTLFATIALFQINKQNILYTDPNIPSGNSFIQSGKARSRGIETSLTGTVCRLVELTANYAYTKGIFTEESDAGTTGASLPAAPENLANTWITFLPGKKRNLSLSAGAQYADKRLAINNTGFVVPAYFTTDVAVQYKMKLVTLRLNANNIFNKRYFYGAQSGARLFPGDPFNFRIGVNYIFIKKQHAQI